MKKWTGERLETYIYSETAIQHLNRYAYTFNYIVGKVVLDIACGEGYGSNLMSEKASKVYSVDIDVETVKKAKEKYKRENLIFSVGSADNIPLEDNSVDVVVSFETIEHHDKHLEMIQEIKRVLKPNGVLIISTPDRYYYSDLPQYRNEFHIKELYRQEFEELMTNAFTNVKVLNQVSSNQYSFICSDEIFKSLLIFNGTYGSVVSEEKVPMYLIAVASNANIQVLDFVFFNGNEIATKQCAEQYQNFYSDFYSDFYREMYIKSNSFKVGNFVLYPLKVMKRGVRNLLNVLMC